MEHNANICMDSLMDQNIKDIFEEFLMFNLLVLAIPFIIVVTLFWSLWEWMKTRS